VVHIVAGCMVHGLRFVTYNADSLLIAYLTKA